MNNLQLDCTLAFLNEGKVVDPISMLSESITNEINNFNIMMENNIELLSEKVDIKTVYNKVVSKIKQLLEKFVKFCKNIYKNIKEKVSKIKINIKNKNLMVPSFVVSDDKNKYYGKDAFDKCLKAMDDLEELAYEQFGVAETLIEQISKGIQYCIDNSDKFDVHGMIIDEYKYRFVDLNRDITTNINVLKNRSNDVFSIPANWSYLKSFSAEEYDKNNTIKLDQASEMVNKFTSQKFGDIESLHINIINKITEKINKINISRNSFNSEYMTNWMQYCAQAVSYVVTINKEILNKQTYIINAVAKYGMFITNNYSDEN